MKKDDIVIGYCSRCNYISNTNKYQFCPLCGNKLSLNVPLPKKTKKRRGTKGNGSVGVDKRTGKYVARISGHYVGIFPTERDARNAIDKYRIKKNLLKDECDPNDTVEDIYNRYIAECNEDNLSQSAIASYENAWKYFPDKVRKKRMIDVNVADFEAPIKIAKKMGRGIDVLSKIKTVAKGICQYAKGREYISTNYGKMLKINSKSNNNGSNGTERPNAKDKFTKEEMKILWKHRTNDNVKVILINCYTGFRPNELLNIKVENIREGFIIGGGKTKAGTNRKVPISPYIQPFIDYFLSLNKTYLIQSKPGEADAPIDLNNWRKRNFIPTLIQYGILKDENDKHLSPKSARKTFASMLDGVKASDVAITKMMGHTNIETTNDFYVTKEDKELKKEIQKLPSPFEEDENEE